MKTLRTRTLLLTAFLLLTIISASATAKGKINFPDIPGYETLVCDFHMHTVFSDGLVWPTVRVDEAERRGLDVISITDHIEYQPHKEDVPTNHNRPYEIARSRAKKKGILLIKGTEITRSTPPGHFNAIFLEDIDPLDTEDLFDVMKAADKQRAFIFWNHPGWKPEHKGWFDVHTKLYEGGFLRGIEVCNGRSYYPEALTWAIEKDLTMIGNSDIHGPDSTDPWTAESHHTLTLVFARDKSIAGVKEALEAGRTLVWYKNQLIGKPYLLEAMLSAAVEVEPPYMQTDDYAWMEVTNNCELNLQIERTGDQGPASVTLPANSTATIRVEVEPDQRWMDYSAVVTNCMIADGKGLPVTVPISLQ